MRKHLTVINALILVMALGGVYLIHSYLDNASRTECFVSGYADDMCNKYLKENKGG